MYTSAVVVRRELLERTGGFDPALSNWEDWDLFWRIALLGEVATVEQVVANHREHAGNTSMNTDAWEYVCAKHLALLDALDEPPFARRARRNLLVNRALAKYWRGDFRAAGARMRSVMRRYPALALNPKHPVRGGAVCHALLPERAARSLVRYLGLDGPA
jgi:GT2 family glycosyltransferase